MRCNKCKADIPDELLVCPGCTEKRADEELERISLARFAAGEAGLFITGSKHLVPASHQPVLTLCHKKRFKRAATRPLGPREKLPTDPLCVDCLRVAGLSQSTPGAT